jgi:DNA-binding NarL/FixJ family response regulator
MVLTNKQREKLVLDLYNEGKTIKEIAKEAKMSFRDIGVILKQAGKQEEQTQTDTDAINIFTSLQAFFRRQDGIAGSNCLKSK